MDEQRQDDQLEPIYNSLMPIQDIALKTSRKQWTREGQGDPCWQFIQHYSFICILSNGSKYCYVIPIIQLRQTLKSFKYCYVLLTIQSISHLFTQLIGQIVLFLTIQFNISYLFVHSLNVKQFYLTQR